MEKETVTYDSNVIGRLGAIVVLIAVIAGVGRVCGSGAGMCPFMSGHMCPFSSRETASPVAPAAQPSSKK